jgi:3-keto-L-gulonate-6-phosphate decarboxylase
LKYSRWVEVIGVADVETLVRARRATRRLRRDSAIAAFDRPNTIALKWGRSGRSILPEHRALDEAIKEESDQDADLVRISGKSRSEFPQSTQEA